MPPRSPVPQEVSAQLQRVVQRWQQLPLDHALSCMPLARVLLDDLAAAAAPPGAPAPAVPDLGPAVVMDQVTVLIYDACEAGSTDPAYPAYPAYLAHLAELLGDLRRALDPSPLPPPDSR